MGLRPQEKTLLVHSVELPPQESGEIVHLPREHGDWEWMSFFVRRLQPGEVIRTRTASEEAAFVILGGTCVADWGQGPIHLGKRKTVSKYNRLSVISGDVVPMSEQTSWAFSS